MLQDKSSSGISDATQARMTEGSREPGTETNAATNGGTKNATPVHEGSTSEPPPTEETDDQAAQQIEDQGKGRLLAFPPQVRAAAQTLTTVPYSKLSKAAQGVAISLMKARGARGVSEEAQDALKELPETETFELK